MLDKELFELARPHFIFGVENYFKNWSPQLEQSRRERISNHVAGLENIINVASNFYLGDFYQARAKEKISQLEMINCHSMDKKKFIESQIRVYGDFDDVYLSNCIQGLYNLFASEASDANYFIDVLLQLGAVNNSSNKVIKVDVGAIVNSKSVAEIFAQKLADVYPDWRVELSARKQRLTVRPHSKKVMVPLNKNYRRLKIEALIAHEIDVHVCRAENGFKSDLGLLQLGFAGYKQIEEGLAKIKEEQVLPSTIIDSWKWYLLSYLVLQNSRDANYDLVKFLSGYLSLRKKLDKPKLSIQKNINGHLKILSRGSLESDVYSWIGNKKYFDGIQAVKRFQTEQGMSADEFDPIWFTGRYDFTNFKQLELIRSLKK